MKIAQKLWIAALVILVCVSSSLFIATQGHVFGYPALARGVIYGFVTLIISFFGLFGKEEEDY